MAPTSKRRSTRQAATRKRSIYAEPDTDDDFAAANEDDEFEPEREIVGVPAPKRRKTTRPRKPQTRSKAAKARQPGLHKTFTIGKARKPKSMPAKKEFDGPSDERIPDWTLLPVEILKQIFMYASGPRYEYTRLSNQKNDWLLKSAQRLSPAFALPALEAFYHSPSILNSLGPHALLEVLQMPKDKRYIDYNVKVKGIYLDVRPLAYVASNKMPFDLCDLIPELPQLQHFELSHPRHAPPFRPMKIQRWTYNALELFDTMAKNGIHLKSWRWTREFIASDKVLDLYEMMTVAHGSPVLVHLTRLSVCGFNPEDSSEPMMPEFDENGQAISQPPGLATSIAKLRSLTDLTFISCDVVMEKFLLRLPTNLQRLELSNCLEITSDMLREFFQSSGSQLKELDFNANAALNLSFTTSLKEFCPRLEVLKVDLHYYSEKFTVNDATALYDVLLTENEVPTWPPTLRHLEISHAQKWSPEAAQNFFRSLVDGASELLDLRTLMLHAHINIPWRDRVGFRDQWIERLRRVYLRRAKPPVDYLGSIRQFAIWKAKQSGVKPPTSRIDELGLDNDMPIRSRKLVGVVVSPHKASGDTDHYSSSAVAHESPSTGQPRRSRRVAETVLNIASKSATPSPESESESEADSGEEEWRCTPEIFIQGLCDVVDIHIDNQRPRENQWTEGDFLDSEVSGDEDWQEGADEEDEGYAW